MSVAAIAALALLGFWALPSLADALDPECRAANFYLGTSEHPWALRSSLLLSPDGMAVAWTIMYREGDDREVTAIRSQLFLLDRRARTERVVAESRVDDDLQVLPLGAARPWPNDRVHELCAIDWSPDSRSLLAMEAYGPLESDNISEEYWIFQRSDPTARHRIDLRPVTAAVKARWRALGRNIEDLEYSIGVVGWRRARGPELVVEVGPGFGSFPERTLSGYWIIGLHGSNPRPFHPGTTSSAIQRFGRRLGGSTTR